MDNKVNPQSSNDVQNTYMNVGHNFFLGEERERGSTEKKKTIYIYIYIYITMCTVNLRTKNYERKQCVT